MFTLSRPAADRRSTGSTIGRLRRLAGAGPSSRLPRRTVRLRLTALYGCLFLVSGAGLLLITNLVVARQSTSTTFFISHGGGVQTHIQGVVGGFSAPVGISSLPPPAALLKGSRAGAPVGTVVARSGNLASVPFPAGSARPGLLRPLQVAGGTSLASSGTSPPSGASAAGGKSAAEGPLATSNTAVVVTPQQLQKQARQLSTFAGKQRSTEQQHLLVISAIALGFMAVISLALGWLISGRALRPLDEAFEAQRRFVANASHELRTPLAMMRTSLDVAVAKPGARSPQLQALEHKLREGLHQADRLVEGFLTLARVQRGVLPAPESVSLTRVLRAAITAHAREAAERSVEVQAALVGEVYVSGSETLLLRMLDNAIDNAIRHNELGGWVRVALEDPHDPRGRAARGLARVVVENGGPPLRGEEVAELAHPFRRLGPERVGSQDGHGLGLSIVAAIAAAHGGTLDLRARPEGGLRVTIELPSAPSSQRAEPVPGAGLPAGARS